MMSKMILIVCFLSACVFLKAQDIKVPSLVSLSYPRCLAGTTEKEYIQKLIASETWAKDIYAESQKNIDEYVTRHQSDSTWIVSRLMMFWKTHSTEIYIKGGLYDHAEGSAPVPTVKFPGQRGGVTAHAAPKLEDIMPYMDDPRGLYLVNRSTKEMEWVDISKTGSLIEGMNNNIMRMAYTSSVLFYFTSEEKYAKFAFDLFDTYMTGMHYRKEPTDLSHGHHQTLAGLSSFEVIQEVAILNSLTGIYDFLYQYIQQKAPQKNKLYSDVFRKWADLQIDHGVAFNNWNLMQAKNVLNIALMLDDDKSYSDSKGNQYYTNYILNINSQRQWSLKKVVNEGFDAVTGMWNESAGYSLLVLNDVMDFVNFFDKYYHLDLVASLPVLKKAVIAPAQYLFPNGYFASFGDSHYGRINTNAAYKMLSNAITNNKPEQQKYFTAYIKFLQQYYKERAVDLDIHENGRGINRLVSIEERPQLSKDVQPGRLTDYITPVFYSAHVSLFNLRNGFDNKNGLMIAMSGSKGNHMHAGGMSMELYGKGYVLGPESGIGTNYFQADYAEYYSQFPAHNTVVVDGISAYPVMKSNHGFEVKSSYPASEVSDNYFPAVSFGNLYFLEPETQSDQLRLISTIRTSDTTAYYIDIFRSKRKDGKDKMHDYFYHNMGQGLTVTDKKGQPVSLQSTDQLSFGGGHLFAYDYIYAKQSAGTNKDINAVFNFSIPGKEDVQMNMWMNGDKAREIIIAKSPRSTAIDRMGLPKEIAELPLPTIVARQSGEAWTKPFAVLFEPSTTSQPKSIRSTHLFVPTNVPVDFTGLVVTNADGTKQLVFSLPQEGNTVIYENKSFSGTFGVVSEYNNAVQYLFLGNGSAISNGAYSIKAKKAGTSAAVELKAKDVFFFASAPVRISLPAQLFNNKSDAKIVVGTKIYKGQVAVYKGTQIMLFDLPASAYTKLELR
jgi:hypothetical protein